MNILEANSKLVRCRICGSSGRISGKRFFGVVCVDDFEKNAVYDDSRGYYLSHGTHGTSFIYNTIEEAVEAWNTKHKSIESTKELRQNKKGLKEARNDATRT